MNPQVGKDAHRFVLGQVRSSTSKTDKKAGKAPLKSIIGKKQGRMGRTSILEAGEFRLLPPNYRHAGYLDCDDPGEFLTGPNRIKFLTHKGYRV